MQDPSHGSMTRILHKLCAVWLLNLLCICICKAIACMYIIVGIKRLTIPEVVLLVVIIELSDQEPHRQVGMGKMMISTLAHWL